MRMKCILISALLLLLGIVTLPDGYAAESKTPKSKTPVEEKDIGTPSIFFPELTYKFPTTLEGVEILHDFVVMNKGKAPLDILKVKPG